MKPALAVPAMLLLAACSSGPGEGVPGDVDDTQPYAGIGEGETINMVGTEPFWSAEIAGSMLTWTTPDQPDGITGTVERFAGRGGYSLSGTLEGRILDATITPAECSDGMSDRRERVYFLSFNTFKQFMTWLLFNLKVFDSSLRAFCSI